jgi:hypothetical protein
MVGRLYFVLPSQQQIAPITKPCASVQAHACELKLPTITTSVSYIGLARTIDIEPYDIFCRDFIKYTVIYGIYIYTVLAHPKHAPSPHGSHITVHNRRKIKMLQPIMKPLNTRPYLQALWLPCVAPHHPPHGAYKAQLGAQHTSCGDVCCCEGEAYEQQEVTTSSQGGASTCSGRGQ